MEQVNLEFYILMIQIPFLLDIVMLIGLDAQMIGKTFLGDVSF